MMDDIDRMYHHLVKVIKERFPQYRSSPFTVGELYQSILPYRLNRRELGLDTVQDYETTLLSLLSGSRGYLVADERMRDAIRGELQSTGATADLIRRFGSEHVALAPEPAARLSSSGEVSSTDGLHEPHGGSPTPRPQGRRGARTITSRGEPCRYCGGALPADRQISFCPHCGQNVTTVNCDACGTELEVGWQFCTTCGREIGTEKAES
jgi:hypothetical protein